MQPVLEPPKTSNAASFVLSNVLITKGPLKKKRKQKKKKKAWGGQYSGQNFSLNCQSRQSWAVRVSGWVSSCLLFPARLSRENAGPEEVMTAPPNRDNIAFLPEYFQMFQLDSMLQLLSGIIWHREVCVWMCSFSLGCISTLKLGLIN